MAPADDLTPDEVAPAAELLLRDVVPAEVLLPDGTRYLRARAFITDQRLIVYVESRPPQLVYDAPLIDAETGVASRHASAGTPHRLISPDGLVKVLRARGTCSCKLPELMALRWPVDPSGDHSE